jgi:hypothetical protein
MGETGRSRELLLNDFRGSEQLGVTAIPPREFLNLIRTQP